MKIKKLLHLAFLLTLSTNALCQFGPGGVGNSTNNGLWLSADQVVATNGDPVGLWQDISGNANNALQSTAGRQPIYVANSPINGQPALRWDGNDDQMLISDVNILDGSSGITYFAAIRPNNLNSSARGILGKRITYTTSVEYAYTFFFYNSNHLTLDIHTQNDRFGTSPTSYGNGVNRIYGFTFDGSLASSQRSKIYVDGSVVKTSSESSTALPNSNQPLCLGALNADYGTYLGADYAEVIQYNYALNQAERIIVENYLSSKYGMTVAQDFYDFDGSYGNQVCGIGRIDAANAHNDSRGNAILRINTPSNLSNNEFLLWGHNGASLADSNTVDVDGIFIESRMHRVWRADETGDVGTLTLAFDMSNFSAVNGADLRLLIDRDGDGFADNDVPPMAGSFAGNTVTFTNVDLQYGDYFTVGSVNQVITPLPLTFIDFHAKLVNESYVDLEWIVENEINVDRYQIMKSLDGHTWKNFDAIAADGEHIYHLKDKAPSIGVNYYLLKEIDEDGENFTLKITSVSLEEEDKIQIFPNPASTHLEVSARSMLSEVSILNDKGQIVYQKGGLETNHCSIDLNAFSKGIYFIAIVSEKNKSVEKFVIY